MSALEFQNRVNVVNGWGEICEEVKAHLAQKKKQVIDEIVNYPPPIPACDVQFNYLLAERSQLEQALIVVREAAYDGAPDKHVIELFKEFIRSCELIDKDLTAIWTQQVEQLVDGR